MASIYNDPQFSFMFLSPLERWKENYKFVKSRYFDLELFFLEQLKLDEAKQIRDSWEEWEREDYKHYKEITDFRAVDNSSIDTAT